MSSRLIIIALVLSLVFVSIRLLQASTTQGTGHSDEDAVYKNILSRTSIRSYQDKAVEKEKVEKLLRAGMAAPSAADRRPWHFVVVDDKEVLKGLAQANPNAKFADKAPLAIIVCGDMDKTLQGGGKDFWIQDCSAVTENILLAAHAMGLGAVWTGTFPAQDRCRAVAEVLHLPAHLVPLNTIVIGYPANPGHPKDKWDESMITYNRFKPES